MTMYTCYSCRSVSLLHSISYIEVDLITKRKNYFCENCWRSRMSNGAVQMCECWNREKKYSCEICEVEFSSFGMHSHSRNYDNWHACFKCLIFDSSASISPCRCIFPVDLNRYLNYSFSQNVNRVCDLPAEKMINVESAKISNISKTSDKNGSFPESLDKTENAEIIYFCNVCKDVFNSKEFSINPQRTHTCEKPSENKIKNLFVRIKPLKYQERGHHGEKSYTYDTGNKGEKTSHLEIHCANHISKNPYVCEVCNKGFTSSYNLEIHRMVHTDRKPFTCDVCNRCFSKTSNLSAHRLCHIAPSSYICEICNMRFKQNSHLKTHRITHTGEKLYICDVCNKSFTTNSNLVAHRVCHTDVKPYICDICNKRFRYKCNLKNHRITHTGEKPYICEVCHKSFNLGSNLKRHRITHTGEKTYICDVCNKSFNLAGSLKKHLITHTGEKPYICDVCNKRFNQSSNLKTHRRIHSQNKPYVCNTRS